MAAEHQAWSESVVGLRDSGDPHSASVCLDDALGLLAASSFVLVGEDGLIRSHSVADLAERTAAVVRLFVAAGMVAGDTLLIQKDSRCDFICAVWSAIRMGLVILPLEAEAANRKARQPMLDTVLGRLASGSRFFLWSDASPRPMPMVGLDGEPHTGVSATSPERPAPSADRDGRLDDSALVRLLILTSGSTGVPSLVALSDRALACRWWPNGVHACAGIRFLSWAPLDHVMGLSACSPNADLKVILHPVAFATDPLLWLRLASDYRVTHATMTCFAMQLIVDSLRQRPVDQSQTFDLSSIQVLGVGAEMMRFDVIEAFVRALACFGLDPASLVHGYGLSECGPVISGRLIADADAEPMAFEAGLTALNPGHQLRIVSADGSGICEEGSEGDIEVCGPTMASGYWGDLEATRQLFTADGWIRTGDLGVIRGNGLVVTGRSKETLVIRAVKYPCALPERLARRVPGVEACYAVNTPEAPAGGGADACALFITPWRSRPEAEAMARAVVACLSSSLSIRPACIVFLEEAAIPRTSLGKVRRFALAQTLASHHRASPGATTVVAIHDLMALQRDCIVPSTPLEIQLHGIWSDILGMTAFGIADDFFALGGNSLSAARLAARLQNDLGVDVTLGTIFHLPTIRALTAFCADADPLFHCSGRNTAIPAAQPIDLDSL